MNRASLAVLAMLVVSGAGLWLLLGGPENERMPAAPPERTARTVPETPAAPGSLPAPGSAISPTTPPPAPESARAEVSGEGEYQSFALDDARWVEVDVVLPAGVPLDEELEVVALSLTPDDEIDEDALKGLIAHFDSWSFGHWGDVGVARREVRGSGRLSLPFLREASRGGIALRSRYVHAEPLAFVLAEVQEVLVLEGRLGAWVTGRIVLPAGADGRATEPGNFNVGLSARTNRSFSFSFGGDGLPLDDELRFEAFALDPEVKHVLRVEADDFLDHMDLTFGVEAGQHVEHEIELALGASVTGRVVDGSGDPLQSASVRASGDRVPFFGSSIDAETAADGSFALHGIPPGEVGLAAHKQGWLRWEEEHELVDGQHLANLEVVLGRGNEIAGHVQWPDGTPAPRRRVNAYAHHERGWVEDVGETKSGDDGAFVISGLGDGPFEVHASVATVDSDFPVELEDFEELVEGLDPGERREVLAQLQLERDVAQQGADAGERDDWIASADGVPAGTRDLVLVLEEPDALVGRVVDDAGAPVQRFTVRADPERNTPSGRTLRREFESEDGTFRLPGVFDGDWELSTSAEHHVSDEDGLSVRVPYDGEPIVLVLRRAILVTGRVVDPAGRPVEDATVRVPEGGQLATGIRHASRIEASTNGEGEFELDGLPASGLALAAHHDDWAPSEPVPIRAEPGSTLAEVLFVLREGATITGEVYDENGDPEEGIRVSIGGGPNISFGGEGDGTSTDAAGRFVLEHVAPGMVTVTAMPSEEELFAGIQGGGSEEEVEATVADLFSRIRTKRVEAVDGEAVHVVLGAKQKAPVRVTGTIRDGRDPLVDAQLVVIAEGGSILEGLKMSHTDESGAFDVTLDRPGDYVFTVDGDQGQHQFLRTIPEALEHHVDLELPVGSIAGVVLAPDGTPAVDHPVRLRAAGGSLGILDAAFANEEETDENGAFRFEHLAEGTYDVLIGASQDQREESARYGAAVAAGVHLEAGGAVDGLRVRLKPAGKLVGTVRDGNGRPVPGAAVFARDSDGNVLSDFSTVITDAAGEFIYPGAPVGRLTLFARQDMLASREHGPVEVAAGVETAVELALESGGYLVVTVLDEGEPVRARLEVRDASGRRVSGLVSAVDVEAILGAGISSKERRVGPLPPGEYELEAFAEDGRSARKSVALDPGQGERPVKLRLR